MIHFENLLSDIREQLLLMSSLTERMLTMAFEALTQRDCNLAEAAEAADSEIDQLEKNIDEAVIGVMATHGPVARDCRLMLVASKISTNLEGIADQATTIARRARLLNNEPPLELRHDLERMVKLSRAMLRDAITAFVENHYELAQEIIPRDKEVDRLNKEVVAAITTIMMNDSATVTRGINLIAVSRSIERAADHAKNIAEDVFYLCSGRDIRHKGGGRG